MPTDIMEAPRSAPLPRGHPVIAWVVIAVAMAGLFVLEAIPHSSERVQQEKELTLFQLQARAIVGAANLGPKSPEIYSDKVRELNHGSAAQRLRFVVLAGELAGPGEAVAQIDELKDLFNRNEVTHNEEEAATAELLDRLYHDYQEKTLDAPDIGDAERQELRRNLGWFGDLALNPDNGPDLAARAAVLAPARRSALTSAAILVAGVGAGSAGFILLVLFFVLWRQMRSHFTTGSPFGGVYAETFALWLALFVGLHLIGGFLPENAPRELLSGIAVLVSLSAMVWPLLRGVPWRRMCDDIGWRWGDRPALEPFFGVVCYLAALPVVIVLVLALFALLQLGPKWITAPTHPIVFKVLQSGWWGWIQALFLASVVAPLMEETMFRGVLYRHLREATGRLGRGWSVVLSALVVSFVFAALHPQGVLAIPVLMTLAFGFTAAREWRGTLVPSMTVHALHNGALMLALILAAG